MNDDLSLIYGRYFEEVSQAFNVIRDDFIGDDSAGSTNPSDFPSQVSDFFNSLIQSQLEPEPQPQPQEDTENNQDEEEPFNDVEEETEPIYVPQFAKLQFIIGPTSGYFQRSDRIGDEYRAKIKFVNMYMNPLKEIAGSGLEGLGIGFSLGGRGGFQWDSHIAVQTQEQQDLVIDLVQEANSDPDFEIDGIKVIVRVSFSPTIILDFTPIAKDGSWNF